jgi:S-adenosylmethionine synthetase
VINMIGKQSPEIAQGVDRQNLKIKVQVTKA